MRKNNKGFTLIEVVLSVLLLSAVMAVIGSLMIGAVRTHQQIYNKSISQQNSELVIAEMRTTCIDAAQITEIKDISNIDYMDEKTPVTQMGEMVVKSAIINGKKPDDLDYLSSPPDFGAPSYEERYYKYDKSTRTFLAKDDPSSAYTVIANNIDSVEIRPLPEDTTFKDCAGILVLVKSHVEDRNLKKNPSASAPPNSEVNVESQFYFRNKDFRV